MFKYALFLLSAVSLFSQTLPAPPACLSGPVTQGSVTLSCSLIDNTGSFGADPGLFSGGVQYVLQVRMTSSDPDVVGFRVGVTSTIDVGTQAAPKLMPETEWRSISKTCGSQVPAPGCVGPGPYVYRYSMFLGSPAITSIQIQELKAASVQTF